MSANIEMNSRSVSQRRRSFAGRFLRYVVVAMALLLGSLTAPGIAAAVMQSPTVVVSTFPSENELFPRDLSTDTAQVDVAGTANGATQMALNVFRDGVLFSTATQPVGATGSYEFTVQLPAELVTYRFELVSIDAASTARVEASADGVLAGDVYLFNGQSNAAARRIPRARAAQPGPYVPSLSSTQPAVVGR